MTGIQAISPECLVLVAIVPTRQDLDIARLLGWYRIPVKSAPKVISVDYLAFYQTAAFPREERWQIRFIAPVLGHELTTRAELLHNEPDHPRAREEYFKLQLGELIPLPQPILAGSWNRITFFYTTIGHLTSAQSINDLPVHDKERRVLWQALRERALKEKEYTPEEFTALALDPAILALLDLKSLPSHKSPSRKQ